MNVQVELYNRTTNSKIGRFYLGDHTKDWDLYSGAQTYAYNFQANSSTELASFELVLSQQPPYLAL